MLLVRLLRLHQRGLPKASCHGADSTARNANSNLYRFEAWFGAFSSWAVKKLCWASQSRKQYHCLKCLKSSVDSISFSVWHCKSMNNLHYDECVKHWNEVVSRNTCINGITIRICFQNPCLHYIYITCRNTDVITAIRLLVMATWYNSVSLLCLWLQMPDFHIIYIYISGFNCLKRASTTHQQQTTHLGTNEEQVSLCQGKDRFRWKINKPAGPGETWGMMQHHNTTKNENNQGEVHRTHQTQRPRPNRDKMEEVWRGRFEEGDSSLQCRQIGNGRKRRTQETNVH